MVSKYGLKLLAAAVATAIAGNAMANTTLNGTTQGDIFLNIENTSTNTSYLYDTGVSQATFNGNSNYSFNLSGDTALTGFLNGTNTFDYSVVSSTKAGGVSTIYITGNISPTSPPDPFANNQAQAPIAQFLTAADQVATASTKSLVLATGSDWGQGLTEGVVDTNLFGGTGSPPYGDNAALNTALAFYNVSSSAVTAFAGSWTFSTTGDSLTYNGAPVPLPTPVLLLLSGLGLMGAVSRRVKSAA
jgi:hypothetical protein